MASSTSERDDVTTAPAGGGESPRGSRFSAEERMRRRFARRQWARRWGAWKPLLALGGSVLVIALVVWAVWFSPLFAVDEVEVTGLDHLDREQVLAAAGVEEGSAMISVDPAAVERRVETLAPVASVVASRSLGGTFTVAVTEREAVAVARIGGRLQGIDAEGVVFRSYRRAPNSIPRVQMVGNVARDALREAAQVVAVMPSSLKLQVERVEVESIDQITLVLDEGRTVLWGSGEAAQEKADVLAALVKATAKDEPQVRHFDVSVPGQPVTSR